MHGHRFVTLALSAVALAACNPFHHDPPVMVSQTDVNVNTRWHGTLTTPATLAGAVQMTGTVSMAPGSNSGSTTVSLTLANATPGGVHPWAVHRGQCGADEGVFGPPEAYRPVTVGEDGRARASATVPLETPTTGTYFVSVRASKANDETIVACANLAPPTQ
jgi:hypothetical protein